MACVYFTSLICGIKHTYTVIKTLLTQLNTVKLFIHSNAPRLWHQVLHRRSKCFSPCTCSVCHLLLIAHGIWALCDVFASSFLFHSLFRCMTRISEMNEEVWFVKLERPREQRAKLLSNQLRKSGMSQLYRRHEVSPCILFAAINVVGSAC